MSAPCSCSPYARIFSHSPMPRPSCPRTYTTTPPCCATRSSDSSSCSPQSQRCDPNASPVRHSECTRTRGASAGTAAGCSAVVPTGVCSGEADCPVPTADEAAAGSPVSPASRVRCSVPGRPCGSSWRHARVRKSPCGVGRVTAGVATTSGAGPRGSRGSPVATASAASRCAMRSSIETSGRPWVSAKTRRSSPRSMGPWSWTSSAMTATSPRSARRHSSTPASVWPGRSRTPPSRAMSGRTWPGRVIEAGSGDSFARVWTVTVRSAALIPVVTPVAASQVTV